MQIKPGKVCSHYIVSSTQKPRNIRPKSTIRTQFSKEATRVLTGDLGMFCLQHSWLCFPLAPELERVSTCIFQPHSRQRRTGADRRESGRPARALCGELLAAAS